MTDNVALSQFTRTAERAANQVIASYSTSFGLASRMLGARHRQHIRNVYALVRVADEIVDGMTDEAGLTAAGQSETLERFIDETHLALQRGCSSDLIVHAFAHTARQCGIDAELTVPFFDSMRTDLARKDRASTGLTTYDAAAHADYIFGSAEVVGLMCLRVFLRGQIVNAADQRTLEHGARQLGAAFQNINFLRDLADDTERLGRSYLGVSDHLGDADRNAWVHTIRGQLADARASIPLLPRDVRAAVRSSLELFTTLTDRIETVPIEELYRRRIRVPDPMKAALAARALFTSWREPRQ